MSKTCAIKLSGVAAASTFDETLASGLGQFSTSSPDSFVLDMTDLTFSDLQTMQRIICFAEYCRNNELGFSMTLPTNSKLIKFLHSWNFFQTIQNVAETHITNLIPKHQHAQLRYDGTANKEDETVKLLAPNITKSRRHNFFSFFTERLEANTRNSIPSREKSYWERQEVIDVLHRVFGENFGDNIGSDIVSEALFNSTRHSNATMITSASFCKKEVSKGGKRSFQLVIWDNGEPIYETLRKPLLAEKSVREYSAQNFRERNYLVSYPEYSEKYSMHSSYDEVVRKDGKDSTLILNALFPGVTSKPFSDQDLTTKRGDEVSEIRIQRGMGFDFVLETAIQGLGGSVSIRSGRYFAKIEKVKDFVLREHIRETHEDFVGKPKKTVPAPLLKLLHRDYFSVSFRHIPDIVPPLNGNLVFINV